MLAKFLNRWQQMNNIEPSENSEPPFSYVHFDLNLSEEQKICLEKLHLTDFKDYENYGKLENLSSELNNFLRLISDSDSSLITVVVDLIINLVEKVIRCCEQESAVVILRASHVPYREFDTPRWHIDGHYFPRANEEEEQYRAAISLKGPSTLFYRIPQAQRETFKQLDNERAKTYEMLHNNPDYASNIESTPPGKASLFTMGSFETGTVHSEPPMTTPRLFMSITPGSQAQIHGHLRVQEELRQQLEEYQARVRAAGNRII